MQGVPDPRASEGPRRLGGFAGGRVRSVGTRGCSAALAALAAVL